MVLGTLGVELPPDGAGSLLLGRMIRFACASVWLSASPLKDSTHSVGLRSACKELRYAAQTCAQRERARSLACAVCRPSSCCCSEELTRAVISDSLVSGESSHRSAHRCSAGRCFSTRAWYSPVPTESEGIARASDTRTPNPFSPPGASCGLFHCRGACVGSRPLAPVIAHTSAADESSDATFAPSAALRAKGEGEKSETPDRTVIPATTRGEAVALGER
mmetsp:Transcript_35224/g.82964  ORF Transcript_35224/g.82964 Transcript_35224/m.82964 type:complete len:220 (-) Transcript_35224:2630-3289(-)